MLIHPRIRSCLALSCWMAATLVASASNSHAIFVSVAPTSAGTRTTQFAFNVPFEAFTSANSGDISLGFQVSRFPTHTAAAIDFSISQFNAITQPIQVVEARLLFTVSNAISFSLPTIDVAGFADDNALVELSDFSRPFTRIGTTGPIPATGSGSGVSPLYVFDVTAFAQSLINSRTSALGVLLYDYTSQSPRIVSIFGLDAADPANRPRLEITFNVVPEPASLVMLGIAAPLVGVLATLRRRGPRIAST